MNIEQKDSSLRRKARIVDAQCTVQKVLYVRPSLEIPFVVSVKSEQAHTKESVKIWSAA